MFGSKKSLEEKIGAATQMFKNALVSLSEVKAAAIEQRKLNDQQISTIQKDNERLNNMALSLDEKIDILKKLS